MIRVGVIGAAGKMGRQVCAAVAADPALLLAAAVDKTGAGTPVGLLTGDPKQTLKISDELDMLTEAEVEVAVDFTHPSAVLDDIRWCVRHAIHCVVGTTGLTEHGLDAIRALIEEEGSESNVFVAPNFAIGAVLMMAFAARAAKYLPAAEIIELHHDGKADAPSGTALRTAGQIAAARGEAPSPAMGETVPGARGADVDGLRVHSVRLPGLIAHQEVILGGPGETLTIRHDSYHREAFMPGVIAAVKAISQRPGLTLGLESLLDL